MHYCIQKFHIVLYKHLSTVQYKQLSTIILLILLVGRIPRLPYLRSLGKIYICISKTLSAFAATNGAITMYGVENEQNKTLHLDVLVIRAVETLTLSNNSEYFRSGHLTCFINKKHSE